MTYRGGQRNFQQYRGAASVVCSDLKFAAQFFCAGAHALESVAFIYICWIKAGAVVGHCYEYSLAVYPQLDLRLGTRGVARDIVDGLLENDKYLTSQVRSGFQSLL